eukprot:NODE_152_length_2340_cov_299.375382_g108_i0.p1 GENE.NODE_152_length_2340_cov_299.375382_g108_i0~~NODE_152_length_2340_cov_299.375382_g108_i0.p1  ORF type:complete len:728 (+),score=158.22 NODE_152_length_2340_cov_299.375382_g108_i0:55-2238(+)
MRAVVVLAVFVVVSAVEFRYLEGKTADPCNKHLDSDINRDCEKHTQWPAPAVTILLPSVKSGGNTKTPSGQNLYNTRLTIHGVGFPRGIPAGSPPTTPAIGGTGRLGLADSRDSCRFIDTTIPPVTATTNGLGNQMTFKVTSSWDSLKLELEDRPRLLCWSPYTATPKWQYTGFKIGVVWNCDDAVDVDVNAKCGSETVRALSAEWKDFSPMQKEARIQKTVCCKGTIVNTIAAGQCINPNTQACCGGAAYEIANERCCNSTSEWVAQVDGQCPCSEARDCPVSESCCLPSKYPELALNVSNLNTVWPIYRGNCYEPTRQSCCDTGAVYDPGAQQCCTINGVQSLNIPCPCNKTSDCAGSNVGNTVPNKHICCSQTAPQPDEEYTHDSKLMCNVYANFPTGQGSHFVQRCLGQCIDPKYQICCNGRACMKTYEKCCNSTCCNKWSATCFKGHRPTAPGMRVNHLGFVPDVFGTPLVYEVCSSMEAITTIKAFWIFVLPAMLLLASHMGLALVLVFASKATPRSFSKMEYGIMAVAVVTSYLAMTLFFAPVWKYGLWVISVQFLAFLAASARIRWLNVLCVIAQVITLIYLFDPFHGNALLTLTSTRTLTTTWGSADDVHQSGLLHAISKTWHSATLVETQKYCWTYYQYFMLDANLLDVERYDNLAPITFGYCSRGWVTALLFFGAAVMTGVAIQVFLCLLGLFYRFRHQKASDYDDEEYEPEAYYQ